MQKGQTHAVGYTLQSRYAVCSRYAVSVSADRSTHTVDLANMAGGNHYLQCKKVKPMQWGTQYTVGMQYTLGVQYAVGMQYAVRSRC